MADSFDFYADSPSAPSRHIFAITPHAANALPRVTKSIYVGTGGQVTLRSVDGGEDVVLKNLANGAWIDGQISHVRASGTTATDLVGFA